MNEEILAKMEEIAKKQDNPVLLEAVALLRKAGGVLEKTEKRLEVIDSLEGVTEEVKTGLKKLETKAQEQADWTSEKLEKLESSGITSSANNPERALIEAVPDAHKGYASYAERSGNVFSSELSKSERSMTRNAMFSAAVESWAKMAARIQIPRMALNHPEDRDHIKKLENAFGELFSTKAALQEGTTTGGGVTVPTIVQAEILRIVQDAGIIAPRARHIPMTSKTLDIPDEATGVSVYWPAEAGTLTQGEPTFSKKTLTANKLIGRAVASSEVLEDSVVGVIPYLQNVFAEKIARELDFQAIEGAGSPFTGVIGASGVNSKATTAAAAGDAITYQDLLDVMFAGGEGSTRVNAVWVCNPAIYSKILGLVDSQGMPIVKFATVEQAPEGTILGRPVFTTNALSKTITVGSDSTGNLYFGPPQALIFGDRRAMRFEVSEHSKWSTDQLDMRLIGRWGFQVGLPAAWTKLTKIHSD